MKPAAQLSTEICILAGGLSRRMGCDKSRLQLGGRTLLGHVRSAAKTLGLPIRVVRRDVVARCGPLGGIYTALKTTKADAVLFLACDMPFVTDRLLQSVFNHFERADTALFVRLRGKPGFPFVLHRETLPIVHRQIEQGEFSLRELASEAGARFLSPPARQQAQLRNINTPREWARAMRTAERESRVVLRCVCDS